MSAVNPPLPQRPKILVVDDNPANLLVVRRVLARVDADLVEAFSGNEALKATLDDEFALILPGTGAAAAGAAAASADGAAAAAAAGVLSGLCPGSVAGAKAATSDHNCNTGTPSGGDIAGTGASTGAGCCHHHNATPTLRMARTTIRARINIATCYLLPCPCSSAHCARPSSTSPGT